MVFLLHAAVLVVFACQGEAAFAVSDGDSDGMLAFVAPGAGACIGPVVLRIPSPLGGAGSVEAVLPGAAQAFCRFNVEALAAAASVAATREVILHAEDTQGAASASTPDAGASHAAAGESAQSPATQSWPTADANDRGPAGPSAGSRQRWRSGNGSGNGNDDGPAAGWLDAMAFNPNAWICVGVVAVALGLGIWWVRIVVFSEGAVVARAAARGLRRNEFSVDYQPIVYIGTRRCIGLKVGLRWKNTRHGLEGAERFMRKLRGSRVAARIQAFVIARARQDLEDAPSCESLYIAVDGWASCLRDRTCVEQIAVMAREFVNTRFVLQVGAESLQDTFDVLPGLREQGVRVGLSGFAAPTVSRDLLVALQPEYLKLHRRIMTLPDKERYEALREHARIGRELNVATIANGVEGVVQFHAVATSGVEFAQGFFVGRAMSAPEFRVFVEESKDLPSLI